jgi:hypothetical protein
MPVKIWISTSPSVASLILAAHGCAPTVMAEVVIGPGLANFSTIDSAA